MTVHRFGKGRAICWGCWWSLWVFVLTQEWSTVIVYRLVLRLWLAIETKRVNLKVARTVQIHC